MANSDQLVSVVIPTCNRSKEIVNCLESVFKSNYKKIEVIVVDNASSDDTVSRLTKYFSKANFKLIKVKENLGAGGGRNRGAKEATGKYLLFVDSDNVIDPKMISRLVEFFVGKKYCGLVGPLMMIKSQPEIIWTYFADINMLTSQARYKGTGERNNGQVPEIVGVGHLPNCFMVKKTDFQRVKGFEEKYLVVYEEADLAEKMKRLGKKCYLYSKAITYHDVEVPDKAKTNDFGFRTPERAYLLARNRVVFMKRNASFGQQIIFFLIFNPVITCYYLLNLLCTSQMAKAKAYLRGALRGITY